MTMSYEIELNRGIGPLRLGMSRHAVREVLGAPAREVEPSSYDFLDPEDRVLLRNQVVETRKLDKRLPVIDLIFLKDTLVSIRLDGTSRAVRLLGRPVSQQRASTLAELQALGGRVYVNAESYFFEKQGLVLTRTKARKDVNSVLIVDSRFKKSRLSFDQYKLHRGTLIP